MSKQWNKLVKARDLALEEAQKSPCVRRKYGAVMYWEETYTTSHNKRVTKCCDDVCIRDVMNVTHGHNTDIGAEIHAEQSLLLLLAYEYNKQGIFLIAGYDKDGNPLNGIQNWPCYSCARIIKSTSISNVWVPEQNDDFSVYSIDEILEHYEREVLESFQ